MIVIACVNQFNQFTRVQLRKILGPAKLKVLWWASSVPFHERITIRLDSANEYV